MQHHPTINRRNFIAISALALAGCGGGSWGEIVIAMPAVLRTDLHYVYYLSLPGQTARVADHTDLVWHAQFYGLDQLEDELRGRPHGLVLDCAAQLFPWNNGSRSKLSAVAQNTLRSLFLDMRSRGLLSRVKYLTPMDEPNLFCASAADLQAGMNILKGLASEFPELSGVKYTCIYGSNANNLWCLNEFDVVGVDNYDQRSEILTKGAHADLMRALLPHQQAMLIPGAAYKQDPAPFVAYAHTEPRCWGVVPFIWCHVPASADKEGWVGLEKQDAAAQEHYRKAGLLTLART